jgi:hypothetical protein
LLVVRANIVSTGRLAHGSFMCLEGKRKLLTERSWIPLFRSAHENFMCSNGIDNWRRVIRSSSAVHTTEKHFGHSSKKAGRTVNHWTGTLSIFRSSPYSNIIHVYPQQRELTNKQPKLAIPHACQHTTQTATRPIAEFLMLTLTTPCSFELISHGIVFLSHNKSANGTFSHDLSRHSQCRNHYSFYRH